MSFPTVLNEQRSTPSYYGREAKKFLGMLMTDGRRIALGVGKAPLIAAIAFAYALSSIGQFYEIYVSYAEQYMAARARGAWLAKGILHPLIGLAVLGLISTIIYISSKSLGHQEVRQVYRDYHTRLVDPRINSWVKRVGWFAALLPWIGLLYGIQTAFSNARNHIETLACSLRKVGAALGCTTPHFSGALDVVPVNLDRDIKFHDWLRDNFGWLDHLLSWWWTVAIAAAVVLLAPTLWKVLVMYALSGRRQEPPDTDADKRRFRTIRGKPTPLQEALIHMRKFQRNVVPAALRAVANLLVAAVALLTLGNLTVPYILAALARDHKDNAAIDNLNGGPPLGWMGWVDLIKKLKEFHVLSDTSALGLWVLAVLSLGAMLIGFGTMATPHRRRAFDRVVLAFATLVLTVFGLASVMADYWPAVALAAAMLAILWVSRVLLMLNQSSDFRARRIESLASIVLAVITGGILTLVVLSGPIELGWVEIARGFGPLAIVLILGLIVFSIIVGLLVVGRHLDIPVVLILSAVAVAVILNKLASPDDDPVAWANIAVVVMPLVFMVIAAGLVRRQRIIAAVVTFGVAVVSLLGHWLPTDKPLDNQAKIDKLIDRFDVWYGARAQQRQQYASRNPASQGYPVFIVAAEGGGIYAAAAASGFLARLQERCPSFAQHVFAISAVSGGAVGSMVFDSAIADKADTLADEACLSPAELQRAPDPRGLQQSVADVIKDDHLSPLTGLVMADMLGTYRDRAAGLTASLVGSMRRQFEASPPIWNEPFLDHWSPAKRSPALVLNTTWVRVGNRVVFAPFRIEANDLVTLTTFVKMQDRAPKWTHPISDISLADAAVTSARFPAVLAALEMEGTVEKKNRRFSFVDGGYVDSSGALTAYDIYSIVKGHVGLDADVRLILLTGSQYNKDELGTDRPELRDIGAPVQTLFSIRRLLSRIAVLETVAKVKKEDAADIKKLMHPAQRYGDTQWKVMTLELNHDDFKLELGWRLSNVTYDVVSLSLGQADLCGRALDEAKKEKYAESDLPHDLPRAEREKERHRAEAARTIRANSCVMKSIERLLGPQQ